MYSRQTTARPLLFFLKTCVDGEVGPLFLGESGNLLRICENLCNKRVREANEMQSYRLYAGDYVDEKPGEGLFFLDFDTDKLWVMQISDRRIAAMYVRYLEGE